MLKAKNSANNYKYSCIDVSSNVYTGSDACDIDRNNLVDCDIRNGADDFGNDVVCAHDNDTIVNLDTAARNKTVVNNMVPGISFIIWARWDNIVAKYEDVFGESD